MKTLVVWVMVGFVILMVTGNAPSLGSMAGGVLKSLQPPAKTIPIKGGIVEVVIDGNTLKMADGRIVRLAQIDAPDHRQCASYNARIHLTRLLPPGAPVKLEADKTVGALDAEGQTLAYVLAKRGEEDLNVNLLMVEDGWAAPYFEEKKRGVHAAGLVASARKARGESLGVWDMCEPGEPDFERPFDTGKFKAKAKAKR